MTLLLLWILFYSGIYSSITSLLLYKSNMWCFFPPIIYLCRMGIYKKKFESCKRARTHTLVNLGQYNLTRPWEKQLRVEVERDITRRIAKKNEKGGWTETAKHTMIYQWTLHYRWDWTICLMQVLHNWTLQTHQSVS